MSIEWRLLGLQICRPVRVTAIGILRCRINRLERRSTIFAHADEYPYWETLSLANSLFSALSLSKTNLGSDSDKVGVVANRDSVESLFEIPLLEITVIPD